MLALKGYWRRRGWLAWHVGYLGRAEFKDGFPPLATLTGEAARAERQDQTTLEHNLRLWGAVLNPSEVGPAPAAEAAAQPARQDLR